MTTDLTPLQERIAHLTRTVEELSDVMARQDRDIAALTRKVAMLIAREIDRDATGADPASADQRPPHW